MVKSIYTKKDALEAETRIDELVALKNPSFEQDEELNILMAELLYLQREQ